MKNTSVFLKTMNRMNEATVRALMAHAKSKHPLNDMVMAPELVESLAADWLAMLAEIVQLREERDSARHAYSRLRDVRAEDDTNARTRWAGVYARELDALATAAEQRVADQIRRRDEGEAAALQEIADLKARLRAVVAKLRLVRAGSEATSREATAALLAKEQAEQTAAGLREALEKARWFVDWTFAGAEYQHATYGLVTREKLLPLIDAALHGQAAREGE